MAHPSKIMVIRHAEKPKGSNKGVTALGATDKESLIVRGWERAGALAALFDPAEGPLQDSNLAVPTVIYASRPTAPSTAGKPKSRSKTKTNKIGSKSKRPLETITPLADRLGIKPNTSFLAGEEKDMVQSALAEKGVVLISWQHEKICEIAGHIVGSQPPKKPIPKKWPDNRFDVVWVFTPPASSSGRWGFVQVPQQLLIGDKDTVIK